jgi:hypothetical protein
MADAIVVGAPVPRTEGPISAERVYNALRTRNASGWTQGRVSPTITTSTGSYSEYRFP